MLMQAFLTNPPTICPRCHGMMVQTYSDLLSPDAKAEHVFYWRCVNCGEYVDRQVIHNRFLTHPEEVAYVSCQNHRDQL
jgi:hypothetical protein